jgi:glycerol kinase
MLKHAELVAALDCGTTSAPRSLRSPAHTTDPRSSSARFVVFNRDAEILAMHQLEFPQYYPHPGFVVSHYDGGGD